MLCLKMKFLFHDIDAYSCLVLRIDFLVMLQNVSKNRNTSNKAFENICCSPQLELIDAFIQFFFSLVSKNRNASNKKFENIC